MSDRIKARTATAFEIPVEPEHRKAVLDAHAIIKDILDDPSLSDASKRLRVRVESAVAADKAADKPIGAPIDGEVVGWPDLGAMERKRGVGQPLGDLSPAAVLTAFEPLLNSRLKRFQVARQPEYEQAARLGLLEALHSYSPSLDVPVGYHAQIRRTIDDAIKQEIRNKDTDALGRPSQLDIDVPVPGEGREFKDEGGRDLCSHEFLAAGHQRFPDAIVHALEAVHDAAGRWRPWSLDELPWVLQMWVMESLGREKFLKSSCSWLKGHRIVDPHKYRPFTWYHQHRSLIECRPKHAALSKQLFRHRRVLEEIRLSPWVDGCTQSRYGTRESAWRRDQRGMEARRAAVIRLDWQQANRLNVGSFPSPMQYALPPLGRVIHLEAALADPMPSLPRFRDRVEDWTCWAWHAAVAMNFQPLFERETRTRLERAGKCYAAGEAPWHLGYAVRVKI